MGRDTVVDCDLCVHCMCMCMCVCVLVCTCVGFLPSEHF